LKSCASALLVRWRLTFGRKRCFDL
jgi:hypothetical protein